MTHTKHAASSEGNTDVRKRSGANRGNTYETFKEFISLPLIFKIGMLAFSSASNANSNESQIVGETKKASEKPRSKKEWSNEDRSVQPPFPLSSVMSHGAASDFESGLRY